MKTENIVNEQVISNRKELIEKCCGYSIENAKVSFNFNTGFYIAGVLYCDNNELGKFDIEGSLAYSGKLTVCWTDYAYENNEKANLKKLLKSVKISEFDFIRMIVQLDIRDRNINVSWYPEDELETITNKTKTGRFGRMVFCPHCGWPRMVGNFEWSKMECFGCLKIVNKKKCLVQTGNSILTEFDNYRVFTGEYPDITVVN